jgi:hypothetical protein
MEDSVAPNPDSSHKGFKDLKESPAQLDAARKSRRCGDEGFLQGFLHGYQSL